MNLQANVGKLRLETTETGVNLHVDGAPEGIHIEHEIMYVVIQFLDLAHKHMNLAPRASVRKAEQELLAANIASRKAQAR